MDRSMGLTPPFFLFWQVRMLREAAERSDGSEDGSDELMQPPEWSREGTRARFAELEPTTSASRVHATPRANLSLGDAWVVGSDPSARAANIRDRAHDLSIPDVYVCRADLSRFVMPRSWVRTPAKAQRGDGEAKAHIAHHLPPRIVEVATLELLPTHHDLPYMGAKRTIC